MKIPRLDLDARDLHFYAGILLGACGGWQLDGAWTLVTVGSVLTIYAVFAPKLGGS